MGTWRPEDICEFNIFWIHGFRNYGDSTIQTHVIIIYVIMYIVHVGIYIWHLELDKG